MVNGGLISFGQFDNAYYNGWQFLVFLAMGVMGAVSGALFNSINKRMTMYRLRAVHFTKFYKVMEVQIYFCAPAYIFLALVVTLRLALFWK